MNFPVGVLLRSTNGFENVSKVAQDSASDYYILHKQVFLLLEVTDKDY